MTNIEDTLENKASFSSKIIQFAEDNDLSLLDGLTEYCKNKNLEVEDVVGLLTNEFKGMLYREAVDLNMFRSKMQKVRFDD